MFLRTTVNPDYNYYFVFVYNKKKNIIHNKPSLKKLLSYSTLFLHCILVSVT